MSARSKARKRALDILFECEIRRLPFGETIEERQRTADAPLNPYTVTLVEGVAAQRERVDTVIGDFSHGWTLARMPAVDRNILRIGVFEILFNDDVPDEVAMSEAVSLAT
ncbi:MAG: transcription antitermination factor NusB, partial [Propionibacteriales bacterium]|nr:transcription antitermination factor NusB [Propionibacteriales bacterium]